MSLSPPGVYGCLNDCLYAFDTECDDAGNPRDIRALSDQQKLSHQNLVRLAFSLLSWRLFDALGGSSHFEVAHVHTEHAL